MDWENSIAVCEKWKQICYLYIVILLRKSVVVDALRDGHGLTTEDCLKTVVCFMMNFSVTIRPRSSNLNVKGVHSIHWMAWNRKQEYIKPIQNKYVCI